MKRILTASLALAALTSLPSLADAAGQFDGTWQVDSGGVGTATAEAMEGTSCAPETIRFEIRDDQVQGSLAKVPSDQSRVEASQGSGSSPVVGTVAADGSVNAEWESYAVTGKITGDKVELHWRASCGPRVAIGSRIVPNATAGSTTSPSDQVDTSGKSTLERQDKSGYFPKPDAPLGPENPK